MNRTATRVLRRPRRVAFVDDHPILLQGLIASVGADLRIDVVASGSTSADARRIAAVIRPDVLVLDMDLHDAPAHQTIRAIQRDSPQVAVLILTALDDSVVRDELLRAGASAFLTKATPSAQLVEQLLATKPWAEQPERGVPRRRANGSILTEQEMRVLHMAAWNLSNSEIALSLCVSGATVKRHLANIYRKMDVHSRAQAASKANLLGLFSD